MYMLIDTPSPFDTRDEWDDFLSGLRKLDEDNPGNPQILDEIGRTEKFLSKPMPK